MAGERKCVKGENFVKIEMNTKKQRELHAVIFLFLHNRKMWIGAKYL
jgi:hypothetical protein